tara:strand:- start:23409 stop:23696 length:288 start_codon:yes stop_codon:yes gene_type:complete
MANKTLTITAPEELMQPTILAYASRGDADLATATQEELEEAARTVLREDMKAVTLDFSSQQRRAASRIADREADAAEAEALSAQADNVVIEFVGE